MVESKELELLLGTGFPYLKIGTIDGDGDDDGTNVMDAPLSYTVDDAQL